MKYNFTFIFFIFISLCGLSQNTRDVVYLKNGSVVKGNITEMNPTENLKIQTSDGSLFVYQLSDVQKTEKEQFVGTELNNNKPEQSVTEKNIADFFNDYFKGDIGALHLIEAKKLNGLQRDYYGKKVYQIEYELIIETEQTIYPRNCCFVKGDWDAGKFWYETVRPFSNAPVINKGERIISKGTIDFEKTDNGWRAAGFQNLNYTKVSSDYVSPEMAAKITEERAQLTEQKKQDGDWKIADISDVNFQALFLKAENVPVFGMVAYRIVLNKLPKKCEDCRNDNIAAIQDAIYDALKATKRYTVIDETTFKTQDNTGLTFISLSGIDYNYKVDNDAAGRGNEGYTCKISYSLRSDVNFKNPQEVKLNNTEAFIASTKPGSYYTTKKYAFDKALEELKDDLNKLVLKQEPIELELVSIVLDKRDKVDKLIFKRTLQFFNKSKLDFVVLKKGDIVFNDKSYSLKDKIAECTFKGEMSSTEIICDVSGGGNKKALAEYVGNTESIIAINTRN